MQEYTDGEIEEMAERLSLMQGKLKEKDKRRNRQAFKQWDKKKREWDDDDDDWN